MSNVLRFTLRKHDLRWLFITAIAGQAIALGIGLWLEQKLIDSSEHMVQAAIDDRQGTTVDGQSVPAFPAIERDSVLTTIKLTAFCWICFSQAAFAYLIISRWHASRTRQEIEDAKVFAQQHQDLIRTRDAVIFGLAKLAESRDPDTGHHLERIAIYSTHLAEAMRRHPRFANEITPAFLKLLGVSSALHDIGKVGVEDAILLKPGRLTDAERKKIQEHAILGGRCIEQIEARLGSSNFLSMAREIALYHHERWDGTGYPHGLQRTEIPLAARIIAVVDVYDALSVRRVYKEPYRHDKCVRIIREGAGTQFDPQIVEVFLQIESDFQRFATEMADISFPEEEPAGEPPAAMTPEQERLLERVITVEKYCSRDPQLVGAGTAGGMSYEEMLSEGTP